MIKVAIIEDHRLARIGIEQVFTRRPDVRVIASVCRPAELDLAGEVPDVIVLDPSPYPGEESFRMIHAVSGTGRVLVVAASSDQMDPVDALAAIRAGAYGVITRHADDDELLSAVEAVAAGGFYLSPGLAPHLRQELGRRSNTAAYGLAPREVETLRWVARGYTHSQIGRRMGLTEATVNTYVKRIRAKLRVRNKAELTSKAIEIGCLPATSSGGTAAVVRPQVWHGTLALAREQSA